METLVTLRHRRSRDSRDSRDSQTARPKSGQPPVTMSAMGQLVLPATFKLTPVPPDTSSSDTPAKDPFQQAGGHEGSFRLKGSTLVKRATPREAAFYEAAQKGAWPTSLLPNYYGREPPDSIKIENLTYGFKRPCVIDLKMGVETVEHDEAGLLKRLKMSALDVVTRSKSSGCRLEGLSMHRTLQNCRINGSKIQSHSISAQFGVTLQDVLTFFLTDESGVRTDVALRFQHLVENILTQFRKNHTYRFIGSSILLIYDNDNRAPYMHWARALRRLHLLRPNLHLSEDQISGLTRRTRVEVRMIDFAHTGPLPDGMARDEGYITGLRTIIKALKAIRTYRAKPIFSMASAVVDVMEERRAKTISSSESGLTRDKFTFDTLLAELTPLAMPSSSQ